jgi:hypothetical protein
LSSTPGDAVRGESWTGASYDQEWCQYDLSSDGLFFRANLSTAAE